MNKFHKDGTLPDGNEVFVFGSNEAGIHGAGAAKVALERFGAIMYYGYGHNGNSYAIPTKDKQIETLRLDDIQRYVDLFVEYTKETQKLEETHFWCTGIGCGLAGYKPYQIAPMFKGGINCSFPNNWESYL